MAANCSRRACWPARTAGTFVILFMGRFLRSVRSAAETSGAAHGRPKAVSWLRPHTVTATSVVVHGSHLLQRLKNAWFAVYRKPCESGPPMDRRAAFFVGDFSLCAFAPSAVTIRGSRRRYTVCRGARRCTRPQSVRDAARFLCRSRGM